MCRSAKNTKDGIAIRCSGADATANAKRKAARAAVKQAKESTEGTAGVPDAPVAPVELTKEQIAEQKRLAREAREEEAERLNGIVENPDATAEELTAVFETGPDWTHDVIAKHPNAPAPVLVAILNDPESYLGSTVIVHRNMPAAELQKALSQTEDRYLAEDAASSLYLTPAMIENTIENGTDNQCFCLVENPVVTDDQLDAIAARRPSFQGKISKRRAAEEIARKAKENEAIALTPEQEKSIDVMESIGAKEWKTPDGEKWRFYVKPSDLGAHEKDNRWASELYFDVRNNHWVFQKGRLSTRVSIQISDRAEELTGQRFF